MNKKKFLELMVIVILATPLTLGLGWRTSQFPLAKATMPDPAFLFVNPGGSSSWSGAWTAETNSSETGTANFTFHSPPTSVGDTFFVNITVTDAQLMDGWAIGVVFDNTTLDYSNFAFPSDWVFSVPSGYRGWSVIPVFHEEGIDSSHELLELGATELALNGTSFWSFNGTGTLCQLQFSIAGSVNATYPRRSTLLTFDPSWSSLYQPGVTLIPTLGSATVTYLYPLAPRTTKLAISPGSVVDPSLTLGKSFAVNLTVFNATDLYRWQAIVYFSNQVLNATGIQEGTLLQAYGSTVFQATATLAYNATHGQITLAESLTGAPLGAYGDGQLAMITFEVLANGSTPIAVVNDTLYDSGNIQTFHTTTNGYFSNVLRPSLNVQPILIEDPTLVPGTFFSINITINNVQNLKMCIFNLTYSPIIIEISVAVPQVLGQNPSKNLLIDDWNGLIWVNLTYPEPITTSNALPVLTVTFQVEGMGETPLDLKDTMMQDANGNPIPHDTNSGAFIGLVVDVAVTQVAVSSPVTYGGWSVQINVTVVNEGNTTQTFSVIVYYDTNLIGTQTVTSLPPNDPTTLTFVWNTTAVPASHTHNYTISAQEPPLSYETNLANNQLTDGTVQVRLMGDINGDGIVTMDDLMTVVNAFGSRPGSARWNPAADLYQDNRIDMTDIMLVLKNFGKRY